MSEPQPFQSLPTLAAALRIRYRGVSVDARLIECDNGATIQMIHFEAPRAVLVDYGLVPADGAFGEAIDEFGTRVSVGRHGATHYHEIHIGAARGRLPSQHPDNAITRRRVAEILKRIGGAHV